MSRKMYRAISDCANNSDGLINPVENPESD
jgi:hypothetical protein